MVWKPYYVSNIELALVQPFTYIFFLACKVTRLLNYERLI